MLSLQKYAPYVWIQFTGMFSDNSELCCYIAFSKAILFLVD